MSKTPPICGSSAKRIRRSIAKSSPVGRRRPWLIHATIRIAASVCGSRRLSDRLYSRIECPPSGPQASKWRELSRKWRELPWPQAELQPRAARHGAGHAGPEHQHHRDRKGNKAEPANGLSHQGRSGRGRSCACDVGSVRPTSGFGVRAPPNLAGLCAARSPASRVLRRNLRALLCAPLGSSSGCCGHDRDNTQHRPRCRGRCAGRLRLQRARCRRSGSARAHCARARIIFARVRLCLPTTAIEGGILRAGGLVGGRFAHTIKRIMDESPTYASGSVHANASMH